MTLPSPAEIAVLFAVIGFRLHTAITDLAATLFRASDHPPAALGSLPPPPAEETDSPMTDVNIASTIQTGGAALFGEALDFLAKLGPSVPADKIATAKQKLADAEAALLDLVEPEVDAIAATLLAKVPGGSIASPFVVALLNGVLGKLGFAPATPA